jgi:hypothetical protein
MIGTDNSPRFPMEMIEATDEYRIYTTTWGATRKDWYDTSGALGYLDYKIKDPDSWAKAKERMEPTPHRLGAPGAPLCGMAPARRLDQRAFMVRI